ncbi:MAG: hypothetical protein ACR2PT_16805 [Endozoicomonas sp.]
MCGVTIRRSLPAITLAFLPFLCFAEKMPVIWFYSTVPGINDNLDIVYQYAYQLALEGYDLKWNNDSEKPVHMLLSAAASINVSGIVLIGSSWHQEKACTLSSKAAKELTKANSGLPWISFLPSSDPEIIKQYFKMALDWRQGVKRQQLIRRQKQVQFSPREWEQLIESDNQALVYSKTHFEQITNENNQNKNIGEQYLHLLKNRPIVSNTSSADYRLYGDSEWPFILLPLFGGIIYYFDPIYGAWGLFSEMTATIAIYALVYMWFITLEQYDAYEANAPKSCLQPLYGDGSLPAR